jgi:uncharacterized membrane protein HdeD (DUF308 family)
MQQIEIVSKFMKNIVWGLTIEGLLVIIVGIMVYLYPDLVGMMLGVLLVISGIVSLALASKVNRYSKIKIDL